MVKLERCWLAMNQQTDDRTVLEESGPAGAEARLGSVEDVIQLVRDWITSAKLKEGDRLPTERALAEQFNINRNQVRRAFLELDRQGLINRHVGRGTFVGTAPRQPPPSAAPRSLASEAAPDYSPAAILQARSMIEPRIAQLAVATATLADLKSLEGLVAEMAAASADAQLDRLGILFFENLAAATHNPLVAALAAQIGGARRGVVRPGEQLTVSATDHQALMAEFRAVIAAVQARDAAAAAAAVRAVLIRASRSFGLLARMELLPEGD
jgi:DNA-binding FadR family transcriptional regulator